MNPGLFGFPDIPSQAWDPTQPRELGFRILPFNPALMLDLSAPHLSGVLNPATADFTVVTVNRNIGASLTLAIKADGTNRTPTWPSWTWFGTAPTVVTASKWLLIGLWCVGPTEADVLAQSVAQP